MSKVGKLVHVAVARSPRPSVAPTERFDTGLPYIFYEEMVAAHPASAISPIHSMRIKGRGAACSRKGSAMNASMITKFLAIVPVVVAGLLLQLRARAAAAGKNGECCHLRR